MLPVGLQHRSCVSEEVDGVDGANVHAERIDESGETEESDRFLGSNLQFGWEIRTMSLSLERAFNISLFWHLNAENTNFLMSYLELAYICIIFYNKLW